MKKTVLKIISISVMGLSLSACTLLNDLGVTKGNVTKMAAYKNEVSFTDFVHAVANSDFSKEVNKQDFKIKDCVADFGLDLEAYETITNSSYENKERSKMEANGSFKLSANYDADNQSVEATLKDELSYNLNNAMLGEASAKHKGKWNYQFQQFSQSYAWEEGSKVYALANKDDKTYYLVPVGNMDLNESLTQVLKMAVTYLDQFDQVVAQQSMTVEEYLKAYNLKFYVDGNIFTATGK